MMTSLLLIQLFLMLVWVAIKIGTRNDAQFGHNRIILLGLVCLAIGIPFLPASISLPVTTELTKIQLPVVELSQISTAQEASSFSFISLISWIYGIGVIGSLSWFSLKIFCLLNIHRQSEPFKDKIRLTATNQPSFSFLNTVYLNPSDAESDAIISHELAHIRRKHSLDILFFQVLKIIFWFNPFIYLLEKNLKEFHEFEADESALQTVNNRHFYAESLLSIAQNNQRYMSLGSYFWNESMIKKRIHTMLTHNPDQQTKTTMKYIILTLTLISMIGLAACTDKQTSVEKEVEKKVTSIDDIDMSKVTMELDKWPKPIGGSISEQIMDHIYYTDNALEAGAQGRVIIRFVVNENGDVEDAFIERGVHQELDDIALHAVNQLEFEPPLKDGKPVKTLMAMPLVFKLPADESKN
jgi:TonB family protein